MDGGVAKRKSVIKVDKIRKAYGKIVAVDDMSFEVFDNEIFGMVGPNAAGKTTTIECLEGLRYQDSGEITVLGIDPQRDPYALRERIGVQLQTAVLQKNIKVWEACDLFSSFYPRSIDWKSLLEKLGLGETQNSFFDKLSGGQKQRVFIALALINDPEIVFLDELTTGLDPRARHGIWDLIRDIRKQGKTIFLTTHFMEEAERLCDRVAIIDQGRIVALDSPENLIKSLGVESRVVFNVEGDFDQKQLSGVDEANRIEQVGERVIVYGKSDALVEGVVHTLSKKGIRYRDLRTEQPNLEDVFLTLTGREMEENEKR